jgi:hypothetical protein
MREPDRNSMALREVQISAAPVGLVCRIGRAKAVAEHRSSCAAPCASNKITVTHSTRPQCSNTGYNRITHSQPLSMREQHTVYRWTPGELGVSSSQRQTFFPSPHFPSRL